MRNLHANQRKILDYLLEHQDGATLDQLSAQLKITNTAVKCHLIKIENLGYLSFLDTKGTIGRPRRRYLLTQEGQNVFPKQYAWLSNVLLELLAENLGKENVAQLMIDLADRVAKSMETKFTNAKSLGKLVVQITNTLNELGYRAYLKQSDIRKGVIIEATNCVYHEVARKHPELCAFDIRFIENVSGMKVKLEDCIAKGGALCRFSLRKKQ